MFKKLDPRFRDQDLNDYLLELNRRIADLGGFTPGGDLTGDAVAQIVAAIRSMPTPEADTANFRDFLRVLGGLGLKSPRSCVASGGRVWVGEHTQDERPGSGRITVVDAATMALVTSVDLAAEFASIDTSGVRDMAQDATYVYCACWSSGQVAIIRKSDNALVGWGAPFPGVSSQVVSVCADGLGSFYVVANFDGTFLQRFSTAACLGQPPDTVGPAQSEALSYGPRKVRYGSGSLFLANGGKGDSACLHKADPATLAETGTFAAPAVADQFGMDCLVAFGSVWVTNNDKTVRAMYRVNPATMALQATIDFSLAISANINCIGVGPSNTGAADTRLLVTNVDDSVAMFVVDPGTNTIEGAVPIPNVGAEQVCSQGNRFFVASPLAGGPTPNLYGIEGAAGGYTIVYAPFALVYDPAYASTLPYDPAPGTPWPPPSTPATIGEALDRLAQQVFGV